jgi:hypothetical protein
MHRIDIMSATSSMRTPLFRLNEIKALTHTKSTTPFAFTDLSSSPPSSSSPLLLPSPPASHCAWSFDTFPCPLDLFEHLVLALTLYKSQPDPTHPSIPTLSRLLAIVNAIRAVPQHTERDACWFHSTEAYKFGLALYVLRLFRPPPNWVDWARRDGQPQLRHLVHELWAPNTIRHLSHQALHHIGKTPAHTGYADNILFPLLHAGIECDDPGKRLWIKYRANEMVQSAGFMNVRDAVQIMERVWARDPKGSALRKGEDVVGEYMVLIGSKRTDGENERSEEEEKGSLIFL